MTGAFWAGVVAGYGVAVPVGAIAVLIAGLTARTSLRVGAAAGLGAATADGVYALIAVLGGAALAAAITPIAGPLRWVAAVVLVLLAAWTARSALRPGPAGETEPVEAAGSKSPAAPDTSGHGPAGPTTTAPGEAASATTASAGAASGGAVSEAAGSGGAVSRAGGSGADAAGRRVDVAGSTTPGRAYLGVLGLTLLNPATVVYFAALVLGRGGEGGGAWFVAGAFLASASWQLLIAGGGALVGRLLTGTRGRRITSLISAVVIAVLVVALVV